MCIPLKEEWTRFYSFWGSFNLVYPERLRSRVFFRPRVSLWHRVLTIGAKMEGILVSHESIADKRNGTPLGFAHFKIGTIFKGGKTEQIFLACSFDVYLYLVKNSRQYLTRLKSYESLKKRKFDDCSVSFVCDSTFPCQRNERPQTWWPWSEAKHVLCLTPLRFRLDQQRQRVGHTSS